MASVLHFVSDTKGEDTSQDNMLNAPIYLSITQMMSYMHDTDLGKRTLLSSVIFFVHI